MSSVDPGCHPHFVSPIAWFVRLEDALARAKAQSRAVLIVHGGAMCAGTRGMVERTLAKEELVEVVTARFVCLASDPAAVQPEVASVVATLPPTASSPVCVYVDADGRVLHSTAGGRPPAVLLNDMLQALAKTKVK